MPAAAEEIAPYRRDRLEAAGAGCLDQRGDGWLVAVRRADAGELGNPQRKWPDAAKQVDDGFRAGEMADDFVRERGFAFRGGLQERAGRQFD